MLILQNLHKASYGMQSERSTRTHRWIWLAIKSLIHEHAIFLVDFCPDHVWSFCPQDWLQVFRLPVDNYLRKKRGATMMHWPIDFPKNWRAENSMGQIPWWCVANLPLHVWTAQVFRHISLQGSKQSKQDVDSVHCSIGLQMWTADTNNFMILASFQTQRVEEYLAS